MKQLYKYAIILAAAVLPLSCQDNLENEDSEKQEDVVVSRTLRFVLPDGISKEAWVPGDEIVVHGEYAKDQVVITLGAGDISEGGKAASLTVNGLKPYVRKDCSSDLYASYPASAVNNQKHCYFYSAFNTTNELLLAACNDKENNFEFKVVTSEITFEVDNTAYTSYAITGRKDATVGYEFFQVKITDVEQDFNQYHNSPLVTISGPIDASSPLQRVYFPGDFTIPDGYELKLFKNGEADKMYTVKTETNLVRGSVEALGDITPYLEGFAQALDVTKAQALAAAGTTANCYVVTAPGVYKFPTYKGNTMESVGEIDKVDVLWETWNNNQDVAEKSLIDATLYEGGYIYFSVPEPFHPGNALIAVRDESEKILWSWHIWMPQTPITTVSESEFAGTEVMSRNLGALVDTPADEIAPVESFGLLYQWGRKDPFPGIGDVTDGTAAKVAGIARTVDTTKDAVLVTDAIENPTVFYYQSSGDWHTEGESVAKTLWKNGTKTVYDPCPNGYRLPSRDKSYTFFNSDSEFSGKVGRHEDLYSFTFGSLVFPFAGKISSSDGEYTIAGPQTILWTCHYDSGTPNGYGGFCGFEVTESDPDGVWVFRTRGNKRANAGSARCVKL